MSRVSVKKLIRMNDAGTLGKEIDHYMDRNTEPPSDALLPPPQAAHRETNWQKTINNCIRSIVSITTSRVRCFDTETPGTFTATGFVVDAVKGIVLTNRHVVSPAPVVAHAVLCNYEQVELRPIYRDPVHDFGFMRYDPAQVRFLDIPGIELCPEGARVGQEIRIVGSDAGEKLSILSGTLARLDRAAPEYGQGEYNDFNTFYMQAASGTSAGSSGSPVLDVRGRAIALNAGGSRLAASSYYLPLDRVARALQYIQNEQPVPRGTLQADFAYKSFHDLSQLGLTASMEHSLRRRQQQHLSSINHGLLVVKSVLRDGPADGLLEPGDILLDGNGSLIKDFNDLEDLLDTHIDRMIQLVVLRAGTPVHITVQVQDLHAITPDRFLEFGGGVVHDVSYQMARSYGISLKNPGVFVASAGYILGTAYALRKSVITGLNNKPVRHLDDFVSIVRQLSHGDSVSIRYYSLARPLKERVMIMHVDRRWHVLCMATRNDGTGLWDYHDNDTQPLTSPLIAVGQKAPWPAEQKAHSVETLGDTLVAIDCYPPYVIDGLQNSHSFGTGVIVSLDPPLVLCDRDTIPVAICSISLTFRNATTIPAHVLFLHPFYNYAILSFDRNLLCSQSGITVRYAQLSDRILQNGDSVYYIGLDGDNNVKVQSTSVSAVSNLRSKECTPPRYRAMNVETVAIRDDLNSQGGVLADDQGRVLAFWMTFATGDSTSVMAGLASSYAASIIQAFYSKDHTVVHGLDVEFWSMQLTHARLLGVPRPWLDRYADLRPFYVASVTDRSSPSGQMLCVGDILLQVNGQKITRMLDLVQFTNEECLELTIFRDGKELQLSVPTTRHDGQETTRVIGWQGMLVQNPYPAAKEQVQRQVPTGVYVSCTLYGSPSQVALKPGIWITELDGRPIQSLDDFLEAVSDQRKEKKHTRVKYITRSNTENVCVVKLDHHYWPTWQIQKDQRNPLGWKFQYGL